MKEHHCVLCGYGDPTPEQLERLKKGELVGIVHVGELVALSARESPVPHVLSARRATILPKSKSDEEEVRLQSEDGLYVIIIRKLSVESDIHIWHILEKADKALCGYTHDKLPERRRLPSRLFKVRNIEELKSTCDRKLCSLCVRKAATVIEIMEAEKR